MEEFIRTVGNVYAIKLEENEYAFCRTMEGISMAFYKWRGKAKQDIPREEVYEFIVWVNSVPLEENHWELVDIRPFQEDESSEEPLYYKKDILNKKYYIYKNDEFYLSTKEECEGLEVVAIWNEQSIVERLKGDYTFLNFLKATH